MSELLPVPQAPARLRLAGRRALSLPVGTRRVLALPGQVLVGLSDAERLTLWRTGLFEDAGP